MWLFEIDWSCNNLLNNSFTVYRRRFEYTRETLLQFKIELEEKVKVGTGGAFGGFGGAAAAPKPVEKQPDPIKVANKMVVVIDKI